MSWIKITSDVASGTFGTLCILSSLPFIGIPFPTRSAADYYAGKNRWNSKLSGGRLSPQAAGYAGAAARIALGSATIFPVTREVALLANLAIVSRGTVLARRDQRPMFPQYGMLVTIGSCLALALASRI